MTTRSQKDSVWFTACRSWSSLLTRSCVLIWGIKFLMWADLLRFTRCAFDLRAPG